MFDKFCNDYGNLVFLPNSEKCWFDRNQVEFLGYMISLEGISIDPKKVQMVLDWKTPGLVRDLQCFLGFANFYHNFIRSYSKVALPLTKLSQKNQTFVCMTSASDAFDSLKQAFTSAPILVHVDLEKPFIIEVDTFDFALGSVVSQIAHDEKLHPIAFHSRKFEPVEINYENHDK